MQWMLVILILAVLALAGVATGMAARRRRAVGVHQGRLAPCPSTPNCVCSQDEDPAHHVEPLRYTGSRAEARARLLSVLGGMDRVRIETATENYIHAVCTSPTVGFKDDAEFLFAENGHPVHVRSASRVGYGDHGVNRARVERIRERFGSEGAQ